MEIPELKKTVEQIVKDIHPTEKKLLNEAKHIILMIQDGCEEMLNIPHITEVWIQKARDNIAARNKG